MKANGVVRCLAAGPPGLERWEAQCLLRSWRSGGWRLYASKERGRAGDWVALEHVSQLEPEEASGRRARQHEPSTLLSFVLARDSLQRNPLSNFGFY